MQHNALSETTLKCKNSNESKEKQLYCRNMEMLCLAKNSILPNWVVILSVLLT